MPSETAMQLRRASNRARNPSRLGSGGGAATGFRTGDDTGDDPGEPGLRCRLLSRCLRSSSSNKCAAETRSRALCITWCDETPAAASNAPRNAPRNEPRNAPRQPGCECEPRQARLALKLSVRGAPSACITHALPRASRMHCACITRALHKRMHQAGRPGPAWSKRSEISAVGGGLAGGPWPPAGT